MHCAAENQVLAMRCGEQLVQRGALLVAVHQQRLAQCDPQSTIRARSRLLCAGLAELAVRCHRALGGPPETENAVAEAASMLSLLTKLDDQVIDSLDFHGGHEASREVVRARTEAFLAPTLASIRTGEPATDAPRCHFAAELGRRLDALALPGRFEALYAVVARGWSIQVDGVAILSADPASVEREVVDRVTSEISGAWLLMITLVGALDTPRWLTDAEQAAFFEWGLHIQRADALADLDKDQAEGLINTSPGWRAHQRDRAGFMAALARRDAAFAYRVFAEEDIDLQMLPDSLAPLEDALCSLGEVGALLRWIHGFLLGRYLAHPLCARAPDHPALRAFLADWSAWHGLLSFPGGR